MALAAGGNISEATEYALLDLAHLPGTVAAGTSAGLTPWLAADAFAQEAVLGARNVHLLLATKGSLLKGDVSRLHSSVGDRNNKREGNNDVADRHQGYRNI